jgi:signal peptide peptidase SppA
MNEQDPSKGSARRSFLEAANLDAKVFESDCKVALIKLHGVIAPEDGEEKNVICWDTYEEVFDRAFSDEEIEAVILDIDISGGHPAETQLLANEIRRQAIHCETPVYAFVRGAAASGGYYLACAADEIYALSTSTVGSIGVKLEIPNSAERDKKRGIEWHVLTAGDKKAQLNPHIPLKPEDKEKALSDLKELHAEFIEWVSSRRGDRLQVDPADAYSGDAWHGRKALKMGLIDGLGDIKGMMPHIMQKNITIITFEPVTPAEPSLQDFVNSLEEHEKNNADPADSNSPAAQERWTPPRPMF